MSSNQTSKKKIETWTENIYPMVDKDAIAFNQALDLIASHIRNGS